MSSKLSIDSAVVLAAFTAILYTWSTAAYNGFLGGMHLDPGVMERSFHQVIYSGLLLAFAPVLLILCICASVLFFYSHLLLPSYIDWVRGSFKAKRKAIKFRRFWLGKRSSPPVEQRAKSMFATVAVLAVLGIFYITSLVYFEHKGGEKAKSLIKSHMAGDSKRTEIVAAQIGQSIKSLRFLACGSNVCAGIEEKTNQIYYFSSTSGYSYLYRENDVTKVSD